MDDDQVVGALFGVPGEALWAQQLGSTDGDYGYDIAVDRQGDIIAIGQFSATIMPAPGISLKSDGGADTYVVKLSSTTGGIIWARRFGGRMTDIAYGVAVDSTDNVYVTGVFQDTVNFGGGPLQATGLFSTFVLKLLPNGEFGWARKIDASGFDLWGSIASDGGGVVVAGAYSGSITSGATTYTSSGAFDIFAARLSALDGAPEWLRSFGGTGADRARGVAMDGSGNVVLTGNFLGPVNFGGGALTTGNSSNGFLLKLAGTTGAYLAAKKFGGANRTSGEAVVVDAANSVFITGSFAGSSDFGCVNIPSASQAGTPDAFIAKYTQAGSCLWVKGFGGTGSLREGTAVTVNSDGDVAVTGSFCGSLSFGGQTLTSASECPSGDVFAARFNGEGLHLNSIRAGGTGYESAWGITQSADGRFFATGGFRGFAEFGGYALTPIGADDAFIVGLAPL